MTRQRLGKRALRGIEDGECAENKVRTVRRNERLMKEDETKGKREVDRGGGLYTGKGAEKG